jgi:hypothetical protein
MNFASSDKPYTHIFFSDKSVRGVHTRSTNKTKYFAVTDSNFKNPSKLLAIIGMDSQVFCSVVGSDMIVHDWYYTSGARFFTKEEIVKYCSGLKWKYEV